MLPFAFGLPGGAEWLVILLVALLLFGRRLPEVMRAMGRSVTEFKKGMAGVEDALSEEPKPAEPKSAEPKRDI